MAYIALKHEGVSPEGCMAYIALKHEGVSPEG